jgi:hypothetical protein
MPGHTTLEMDPQMAWETEFRMKQTNVWQLHAKLVVTKFACTVVVLA